MLIFLKGLFWMTSIISKVLNFYKGQHFNDTENMSERATDIVNLNVIEKFYPDLDRLLRTLKGKGVVEVGCGTGWLTGTMQYHYEDLNITGLDASKEAANRSIQLFSEIKKLRSKFFIPTIVVADLFAIEDVANANLIVSIGVLHHTKSTIDALNKLMDYSGVQYIYLGLYHKPSRQHFFDYIKSFGKKNSEKAFQSLFGLGRDVKHFEGWYHDQVNHVHETQHTLEEMDLFFRDHGWKITSTSLNKFEEFDSANKSASELDDDYSEYVKNQIYSNQRFMPGFFTMLVKKCN